MAKDTWRYINESTGMQLNKISNLFSRDNVGEEGNAEKGTITLLASKDADEVWGPEAKVSVSWEQVNPAEYHQGLKVKETIRMFSAIEVVATNKENKWHLSHDMTIWYGSRQQVMRRRFYVSKIIHAIMFCELTHRLFDIHAIALGNFYEKYEKSIQDIIDSLQCHGS